ncbi:sodium/potassium-transporting ATPase subunit beta-1-like [Tribolium madens]|uniref:sodium/potassium-transporting ATPase subunit beta-1-like n=1 Tax=Tribolium madens TaxID=41895 RepID=UPI001CF75022|nr:sodium/potassium-transporting ATPase subunit beta-1-like [Tribolium madens]
MATKENENGVKGFQMRQQVHRTKWETFKNAIYNPSTKEFLGRTGKSWGQLLTFYFIFYVVLAALFAICMQALLATLDDKEPKWQLERSLIGTNPGLGFRPISERTEEGSLIWYDQKNETAINKWVKLIDKFLDPYLKEQNGKNFERCDFDKPANDSKVCEVNLDKYGDCSRENSYGYNSSSPCVFLKLNKIFGWVPEYYTNATDEMRKYDADFAKFVETNGADHQVWVSCQGEKPVDKENTGGFRYFPSQGFPSYYFPYKNVKNYLSPLVAVQVLNTAPNVIISIECRAWAKNIKYSSSNLQREGSVRFEILRD